MTVTCIGRIRGSILNLVLVILTVMATLVGSLLLVSYHRNLLLAKHLVEERLQRNAGSGIHLLLAAEPADTFRAGIDLYGKGMDTVQLQRKTWGAFEVVSALARQGRHRAVRIALAGTQSDRQHQAVLYLADEDSPLTLAGSSSISGDVVLPRAGLRRADRSAHPVPDHPLLRGVITTSKPVVPVLPKSAFQRIGAYTMASQHLSSAGDAISPGMLPEEGLVNSFLEKCLLIESAEAIVIGRTSLRGNILIRSQKSVTINSEAQLQDVIIVAPYILLQEGVTCSAQLFATDSLVLEKGVTVLAPSLLAVANPMGNGVVRVGQESRITADILVGAGETKHHFNILTIGAGAVVRGQVYVEGAVEHRGRLTGSLACSRFFLRADRTLKRNFIQDAVLEAEPNPLQAVSSLPLSPGAPKRLVKWIN